MQGAGNDYIYIDCFKTQIKNPERLAIIMSPRRLSVGADGVILICPSDKADAKMRIFNLDGSEGKMCGNGIRCVGKYLFESGIVRKNIITVETLSGIKQLSLECDGESVVSVTVEMGKAEFKAALVPVISDKAEMINEPLCVNGREYRITAVSMGNPHAVVFCDDVKGLNLEEIGPGFEQHRAFPESVNTEFIKVINETCLEMRVFERGSGETFACGTGACGAVAAAVKNGLCPADREITVNLTGGKLFITYRSDGSVAMRGGAVKVYEGVFEYES